MIEYKLGRTGICTNYLDDFIFYGETEEICNSMVRKFLELCDELNCPVSMEKTEWAVQRMTFLGIILNGKMLKLMVPQEKKLKALNLLKYVISKKKVTILTVQRLTGLLNFLTCAIVPGHAFTRRMYDSLKWTHKLKQHHHIHLNQGFIEDCKIWQFFFKNSLHESLTWPFQDLDMELTSQTLQFYSDALASRTHGGMGAVYDDHWIIYHWGSKFIDQYSPSIEFLELFALVAAVLTWTEKLSHARVRIFCDNKSVCDMINGDSTHCANSMKLIRLLTLDNLKQNRHLSVLYVKSKDNFLADPISRGSYKEFWVKAPVTMRKHLDKIPDCLLPPEKFFW